MKRGWGEKMWRKAFAAAGLLHFSSLHPRFIRVQSVAYYYFLVIWTSLKRRQAMMLA